ncbi:hypothetical protein [Belliella pelovolcani]|uniref:hypothetical protein n=1 Tax=Belliella pelovolcani TaxID=529505 RepID=UPI003919F227
MVDKKRAYFAKRKRRAALVFSMLRGMLLCMRYMVADILSMDRSIHQNAHV